MREIATPEGKLVLTESALAGVAAAAALACPGVLDPAGHRLQDDLALLLRDSRDGRSGPLPSGRGVEVELDGQHCTVALDIVVAFGVRISTVCRAVVEAVTRDLRAAVGFAPDRVDVRVVGVRPAPTRAAAGGGAGAERGAAAGDASAEECRG